MKHIVFFTLMALLPALASAQTARAEEEVCDELSSLHTCDIPEETPLVPMVVADDYATYDYKNTKEWNRNRVKKLAAGTCIGVGVGGAALLGLVCAMVNAEGGGGDIGWPGATAFGVCGAVALTSVPLFISAGKDRRKARLGGTSLNGAQQTTAPSASQQRDYRQTGLRYELSAGMTLPWEDAIGNRRSGWLVAAEGRSYLGSSNFDLAMRLQFDITSYDESVYWYNSSFDQDTYQSDVRSYGALRLSVFADYNILKGKPVNPYIGVGAGVPLNNFSPYVAPRVGVEMNDHHRIALSAHIALDKDPYSDGKRVANICLSYGYTF